jgi:perosamine synthetase
VTLLPIRIPLSQPDITEAEINAVVQVLRSSRLSLGPKLQEFESALAEYVRARHAVALSSGTSGLCLGLQALGIGEGDEVIVPSFTFIAAANAIRYVGATPVFVDIHPRTLNLDPEAVRQAITPRTRAIMVVHTFGYPADLEALMQLAGHHNIHLVEDACEALGAELGNQKVGSLGKFGVFSFYPNKPITTGEGGVLVTQDAALAETVRALRNQGRSDQDNWNQHSLLGYNHRLPEMSCALGVAQLSRIESILARRAEIARDYAEALSVHCPDVEIPLLDVANGRISWFCFVPRLPVGFTDSSRDLLIERMAAMGIQSRGYFSPVHKMQPYAAYTDCHLPVTSDMSGRTLALPFFNQLEPREILDVCQALHEAMSSLTTQ